MNNHKVPLSDRQQRMLEYIAEYIYVRGYPPSMRNIRDGVGFKSTDTVKYQLGRLEAMGYLQRDRETARSIRLCPK